MLPHIRNTNTPPLVTITEYPKKMMVTHQILVPKAVLTDRQEDRTQADNETTYKIEWSGNRTIVGAGSLMCRIAF